MSVVVALLPRPMLGAPSICPRCELLEYQPLPVCQRTAPSGVSATTESLPVPGAPLTMTSPLGWMARPEIEARQVVAPHEAETAPRAADHFTRVTGTLSGEVAAWCGPPC